MWTSLRKAGDTTNKVVMPVAGVVSVTVPSGVEICAYVNDVKLPSLVGMTVAAGDTVYFELINEMVEPSIVTVTYNGEAHSIHIEGIGYKKPKKAKKGKKMDTSNLFAVPVQSGAGTMGGAIGGGLGAGLLGGVLGGALLNNGGLFGNNKTGVTTESVESIVNNSSILQALGDIKASIPFNEGQVQLALAATQADINSNINNASTNLNSAIANQSLATANGFANLNTNLGNSLANITSTVNTTAGANLAATLQASKEATANSWALTQAITNDGDKTRALIQSIDKTNDSRLITNLSNEITELRGDQRLTAATGNITISNNNAATANQAQQQAQLQQQQIALLAANVAALVQQNQHIQQGILNIGSGVVAGNPMTAANTRVN